MNGARRKGDLRAQLLPALPAPASFAWLWRGTLPLKPPPVGLGQEPPGLSQCRGAHTSSLGWYLLFSEPPLWLRAPGCWSAGGDGQDMDRNSASAEVLCQGSSQTLVRDDIPWVQPHTNSYRDILVAKLCHARCRNRHCFPESSSYSTASAVTTGLCLEGRMAMEAEEMPLPPPCT